MKNFLRTWIAEYRRIFLDPGAILILVVALPLYAAFYPIPYQAQVLKNVPIVAVDEDQSDSSRRLIRMVDAHELTAIVGQAENLSAAEAAVRRGEAGGVLVIPADFERRIRRGEQASVSAYTDASYFLVYRQALTAIVESTGTLSAGVEVKRLMAQGLPADRAMKARDPLPLVMRPLFNAVEGYSEYVVPAVLVLILQQTLMVGLGMVGGTRRERRAARGPEGPERGGGALSSLLGSALAYFSLYLLHALAYFGIVYRLYGYPQRADALTLFRFVSPFLLSVVFLGLAVRSLFRSREMSMQVLLFSSLPALFVSGFAWPVESIPRWLATFAKAIPSTSAVPGILRLTQMGASLPDVRDEWLMLWALTGVYFAGAWVATACGGMKNVE